MPAALVTGVSRLRGIAVAVVRALVREGWVVVGTGFRPYDETELWGAEPGTPERLLAEGALLDWFEDDLSQASAPARVLAAAENAAGPLTALVIVHTESRLGGVLDTSAAALDRHMAVNVRSSLLLCAEFARRFRGEPGSGRIVAFTSGALHGEVAYGASKAALERVVVAAAAELAGQGITVNAVDPGATDTGWMSPEVYERHPRGDAAWPCRPAGGCRRARRVPVFAPRWVDHRPGARLRRWREHRPVIAARRWSNDPIESSLRLRHRWSRNDMSICGSREGGRT